jgi:thiosulfate dehydrogenase (quinone)
MVAFSALPKDAIRNDFAYNKFSTGPYGLVGKVGAMAEITLPLQRATGSDAKLRMTTVSGNHFDARVNG